MLWNIKNTIELPQSQQRTRRYMFPVKQQHHPTGSKVSHMHFMNKYSTEKTMMAVFFPMAEASSQIPCWLLQWPGNPEHSVIPLNECESYRRRISFLFTCICWLPLCQSIGGVDLLSAVYIIWSKCMLRFLLSPNESAYIKTLKETHLR